MGGASRYTRRLVQIWDQQWCSLSALCTSERPAESCPTGYTKNIAVGNPLHSARRYCWRPLGDRQDAKLPERAFSLWRCEELVPNLRSLCLPEGTIHKISSSPNNYQNRIPTPNCSNGHHGAVPNFFPGKSVHTRGERLFYSASRGLRHSGSIGHYCI